MQHHRAAVAVVAPLRRNQWVLFVVSFFVLIGHVAGALHDHHAPVCIAIICRRRGACFDPTIWDYLTFFGSIGVFFVHVSAVHPLHADDLDVARCVGCCRARTATRRGDETEIRRLESTD